MKNNYLPIEEQHRLVEENIRLAYYIADKFYNVDFMEEEELDSFALIGLVKASQSFDKSKGNKFTTYAGQCITNEILMALRKARKSYGKVVSLDEILNTDIDGNMLTFADILPDPDSDFSIHLFSRSDFEKVLSITLNLLNNRDRLIILYTFSNKTQKEIANALNITQSYVSRLQQRLFLKIKNNMKTNFAEIFSVQVSKSFYCISFFNSNIPEFNQVYSKLLETKPNIIKDSLLAVHYEKEHTILCFPADTDSFVYIADFFKELI